ncbi:MAG: hypothetical protein LC118_06960 [Dehalococcoidia bacterium]|nr:hypothetical protein [Dehalococcoidia bacterium]
MGSESTPTLCVVSTDPSLRHSLARWVRERASLPLAIKELDSLSDIPLSCVVLTTAADCPPARADRLVRDGSRLIVVAAYPSDLAKAEYEAAGATYLAMSSDTGPLEHAVLAAVAPWPA